MPYETDEQYSLLRTIRYNIKNNDNPFNIKYYGNAQNKNFVEEKKTPTNFNVIKEKYQERIPQSKVEKPIKDNLLEKKN